MVEEPMETLLAMNLERLTGVPLSWVCWAWAMGRQVDLVATDPIGRIHLFELKKASVGLQEVSQLQQYLLAHVFGDAAEFLVSSSQHGRGQAEPDRLVRRIAGLFSNSRTENVGRKGVVKLLGESADGKGPGGRRLTQRQWEKLDPREQSRRVVAALREGDQPDGGPPMPQHESLMAIAKQAGQLLRPPVRETSTVRAKSPVVLWLVGRTIQPKALDQIRIWRRSGLDARGLILEGRYTDTGWTIRSVREVAPHRDAVEMNTIRIAAAASQPGAVTFDFYEQASPAKGRTHGGQLLSKPIAHVTYVDGSTREVGVGANREPIVGDATRPGWSDGFDGPVHGEFASFHRTLTLEAVPAHDAPWHPDLAEFALSFDAYAALGSLDAVADTANRASAAWKESRALPSDLIALRACLFFEQRRQRHLDQPPSEFPPEGSWLQYVRALVDAIRAHVQGLGS